MKFSASRFIAPSLLATTIVTLLTQQAIAASNAPQADEVITEYPLGTGLYLCHHRRTDRNRTGQ